MLCAWDENIIFYLVSSQKFWNCTLKVYEATLLRLDTGETDGMVGGSPMGGGGGSAESSQ
jgi:hypothetical protein